MQKWEYKKVELGTLDTLEQDISPYGADGWELVAMTSVSSQDYVVGPFVLVFKRPVYPRLDPEVEKLITGR